MTANLVSPQYFGVDIYCSGNAFLGFVVFSLTGWAIARMSLVYLT
ncbi:hypothetical protein [Nostoc sp.]